ncbi:MAG: PilZ domain-containing protein [Proteobacteria bacterium]|nr:PilZ domain-containing protein [Pseudomonadota bacterium]
MKKIYVDDTNQATIICPKCLFEKNIDVTNFKDTHKRLKAKCRCGEVFRFSLEYRKHYRKKVRLSGKYFVQGKDEKGEIIIEDISASGIRFASLKPHYISRNDTVELKFILDNQMRTEIQGLVKIIWIIDRNVGAEYIDPKSLEKGLGFYLQT